MGSVTSALCQYKLFNVTQNNAKDHWKPQGALLLEANPIMLKMKARENDQHPNMSSEHWCERAVRD